MPRGIRRNKEHDKLYRDLKEADNSTFETFKDILMLAACIGFKHHLREPFDSSIPIDWEIFNGRTDLPIINAFALKETGDVRILLNDDDKMFDEKARILEEYANGGMQFLQGQIIDASGDPLDNLIALLAKELATESKSDNSLEGVVDNLF